MSGRSNRLSGAASPYLRQHAGNPVAWQPWDEEALSEARAEDKPIFLSIGYSTCHWCHVMAEESFSDPAVAALLNDAFICIKLDREERPDLDAIYMRACQAMTGAGGWPLNVFLAPDGRPFYAATYLAKDSQPGKGGLLDVLTAVRELWRTRRDDLLKGANELLRIISSAYDSAGGASPDLALVNKCFTALALEFDPKNGGFGVAPKFPSVSRLLFLLRYWQWTGDRRALGMATLSLERILAGGIYDHVGGGCHRYATDEAWQVPHFEKMLYDQAQLAYCCTEAYLASGQRNFLDYAGDILEYMLRDLRDPEGAFYSAEDADSEGQEGAYYLWTLSEIGEVLDEADARLAALAWGIKPEGNHHTAGEGDGSNILRRELLFSELASSIGENTDRTAQRLDGIRLKMRQAREKRPRPARDTKILADWNGLAIAALARYGVCAKSPRHIEAAASAACFVTGKMSAEKDGALLHMWSGDAASVSGMLDDYAFLIWGLFELYQAGFELSFLCEAQRLSNQLLARFQAPQGAFFLTEDTALILRPRTVFDGALPSGNSVALSALLSLSRLTGNAKMESVLRKACAAFTDAAEQEPGGHSYFLMAAKQLLEPSLEVTLVGERAVLEPFISVLRSCRNPQLAILLKTPGEAEELARLAPHTATMIAGEGKASAYLCQNYACLPPVHTPEDLSRLISEGNSKRI